MADEPDASGRMEVPPADIRALRLFAACSEAVVRAGTEEALLSAVCAAMVRTGGYRVCWVGVCEDDSCRAVRPVAQAGFDEGHFAKVDVVWADEPRGRGATGTAARTGKPVVSRDLEADPALQPWRNEASMRGLRASGALPLVHDGDRIGVITFYSAEPQAFDDEELRLLVQLADGVAYGVQSLRARAARTRMHDALREQKRVDAALRETEERLEEAQRNARIGSWRYVPGLPLRLSDELYDLFGLSRGTPPTRDGVLAAIHPEDRDRRLEAIERTFASSASEFSLQCRVIWADGRVRTMNAVGRIRRGADGAVLDASGTVQDVTELKAAEEEARRAVARMEVLAKASKAFAEVGLDDRAILGQLARYVTESLADTCQVATLREGGLRFELEAVHSREPEIIDLIRGLEGDRPWRAESAPAVLQAIRTGEPVLVPVITREQLRASAPPERAALYDRFPPHSAIVVAMRAHGRVLGVLAMTRHRRQSPQFAREDMSLAQDLADRAALTIRGARLFEQARHELAERTRADEELKASRQELRSLAGKLDAMLEQERMRIARDLHDDMGQLLLAVKMDLRWVERRLAELAPVDSTAQLQDRVVMASSLVDQMVKTVQRIAADLRPPGLERIGLGAALSQEARRFQERVGVACDVHVCEGIPDLPAEVATGLYRIAQEALTNVARHAGASRVTVSLAARDGAVVVRVDDDGSGMCTPPRPGALGILGMRERALRLGGELRIEAGAPRGTSVVVRVPLAPPG
jgi:PAS domain S-box-containing protein